MSPTIAALLIVCVAAVEIGEMRRCTPETCEMLHLAHCIIGPVGAQRPRCQECCGSVANECRDDGDQCTTEGCDGRRGVCTINITRRRCCIATGQPWTRTICRAETAASVGVVDAIAARSASECAAACLGRGIHACTAWQFLSGLAEGPLAASEPGECILLCSGQGGASADEIEDVVCPSHRNGHGQDQDDDDDGRRGGDHRRPRPRPPTVGQYVGGIIATACDGGDACVPLDPAAPGALAPHVCSDDTWCRTDSDCGGGLGTCGPARCDTITGRCVQTEDGLPAPCPPVLFVPPEGGVGGKCRWGGVWPAPEPTCVGGICIYGHTTECLPPQRIKSCSPETGAVCIDCETDEHCRNARPYVPCQTWQCTPEGHCVSTPVDAAALCIAEATPIDRCFAPACENDHCHPIAISCADCETDEHCAGRPHTPCTSLVCLENHCTPQPIDAAELCSRENVPVGRCFEPACAANGHCRPRPIIPCDECVVDAHCTAQGDDEDDEDDGDEDEADDAPQRSAVVPVAQRPKWQQSQRLLASPPTQAPKSRDKAPAAQQQQPGRHRNHHHHHHHYGACETPRCIHGVCVGIPIDAVELCASEAVHTNRCSTPTCSGGHCRLVPVSCDDGDDATADLCDPVRGCINVPRVTQIEPPCPDCDGHVGRPGASFEIPIACTQRPPPPPSVAPCFLRWGYDLARGTCTPVSRSCDDRNLCTTDACVWDPTNAVGRCTSSPVMCNNTASRPCWRWMCDRASGRCVERPLDCDDGDARTEDACVPSTDSCVHVPWSWFGHHCRQFSTPPPPPAASPTHQSPQPPPTVGSRCGDGGDGDWQWTIPSLCLFDAALAVAAAGPDDPPPWEIGGYCFVRWEIDADTLRCVARQRTCDDGDAETADSCDPASGHCRHDRESCDDGNPCTNDTLAPHLPGGCSYVLHPCSGGGYCSRMRCDGRGGCVPLVPQRCLMRTHHRPPEIHDDDARFGMPLDASPTRSSPGPLQHALFAVSSGSAPGEHRIVAFSNAGGAGNARRTAAFAAGAYLVDVGSLLDACTIAECSPVDGECRGRPVVCPDVDGNPCTRPTCSLAAGGCVELPDPGCASEGDCSDTNPCTVDSRDAASGGCVHWNYTCPDISLPGACTVAVCDGRGGCTTAPRVCLAPDDGGDPCTVWNCVHGIGCTSTRRTCPTSPIPGTLDGAGTCVDIDGGASVCAYGECRTPLDGCDDGDACTVDAGLVVDGCLRCTYTHMPCDDGDACTVDRCVAGNCTHAAVVCPRLPHIPCMTSVCVAGACVPVPATTHGDLVAIHSDGVDSPHGDACTFARCSVTHPGVLVMHHARDGMRCIPPGADPFTSVCHRAHSCRDGRCVDVGAAICAVPAVANSALARSNPRIIIDVARWWNEYFWMIPHVGYYDMPWSATAYPHPHPHHLPSSDSSSSNGVQPLLRSSTGAWSWWGDLFGYSDSERCHRFSPSMRAGYLSHSANLSLHFDPVTRTFHSHPHDSDPWTAVAITVLILTAVAVAAFVCRAYSRARFRRRRSLGAPALQVPYTTAWAQHANRQPYV